MEGPSYSSVNKSFSMGAAYGIFKLVCSIQGIPLMIVPPTKIKKYFSGSGHSKKSKMMESCYTHLGLRVSSDDVADALACCSLARDSYSRGALNTPGTRASLEVVMSTEDALLDLISM